LIFVLATLSLKVSLSADDSCPYVSRPATDMVALRHLTQPGRRALQASLDGACFSAMR
jgi:hypothetical protein